MEKLLPSPPGSISFRHLPSQGSWMVSALASGDQVFGQMIHSVPAEMEAELLWFVISTPVIDGAEGKSPLYWPNRIIFLPAENQSCKQKWIAFKNYKGARKEKKPLKTQVTFATQAFPTKKEKKNQCMQFSLLFHSNKVIYLVISIWYSPSPPSPLLFTFLCTGKFTSIGLLRNRTTKYIPLSPHTSYSSNQQAN